MRQVVGGTLLVTGLLVYPVFNAALGYAYLASPTFGAPCPTTIFTLGLLVMAANIPWRLWVIPVAWSAVGGTAAFLLGVPQDYALAGAGLCALIVLLMWPGGSAC